MAAYPAVIELRVDGVTQVTRVLDTISKLDNALVNIKKTPLAIDAKNAIDGIRVLKKEVDDFVIKLGNGQRQLASTTAGLNSQAQAFKQLAANTKIAGESFKLYTQAAEQARQKTSLKGGLAEIEALNRLYKVGRTAPTQSFMGVDELLALGEKLPKNIASLELYRSELQRVFSLVDIGTKEFEELAAAIAKVDKQVSPPTAGGGRARGPSSPIGGRADIPGSPAALKAAQEARDKLFENLALGAGFPLLFGGGPGQVLGGLAGSFVGTGFGGQILGSAIGGQLEQLGIAATKAGQALQKPIDNFSTIEERALLASSSQERYVKNLIDAGQYIEATAAIQKRYNEVVGAQGSAALVELTQSSDKLNRAWSELGLQIQAALAGPLAGLLKWVTSLINATNEVRTGKALEGGLTPEQRKEITSRREALQKGRQRGTIFGGLTPQQAIQEEQAIARRVKQFTQQNQQQQRQPTQQLGFQATDVKKTASIERRREIQAQITQLRQAELTAAQTQLQQDTTILTKQQEFALSLNQQSVLIDKIAAKKLESANLEYQQVYRTQQIEVTNAQLALEAAQVQAKVTEEKFKQLQAQRPLTEAEQEQLQSVRENVLVKEKGLSAAKAVLGITLARAQSEYDSKNALIELERRQQNVAAYAADAARQTEAFNRAANEATNALNNRLKVSDALTQAALTVNNIEIQSLQNKLAQATTDGERLRILDNIRDLEIANAALTLQATRTQIQAEVERQRIAMSMAEVKYKELQAVVQLAAAQKVLTQSHLEALRAQGSALQIARDNYATSVKVADAQMMAANAVYNASVNAANLRVQMEGTAAAAGAVAGAMDRVAASSGGGGGGRGFSLGFGEAENNPYFMKQFNDAIQKLNQQYAGKSTMFFAEQAYNATLAEFRRRAEEFNQRKAKETLASAEEEFYAGTARRQNAMANYSPATAIEDLRASVTKPQVNITTGPVMQMDGTNYVTQRDLVSATGTAARQGAKMALEMLQNNPASRRSTGVTR